MTSNLAIFDRRIGEILAHPDQHLTAPQAIEILATYGTLLDGGGYVMGDVARKSPMAWAALLYVAASASDGMQWTFAHLLADGAAWEGVRAVNVETGNPASEDDAYDETKTNVIPFDYFQVLTFIDNIYARSTQAAWLTVARRFPLDPESPFYQKNPAWSAAKFAHFQVLAAMDLSIDIVDQLLRRAGRPKDEGGLSTNEIITLRQDWRKERDEAAKEAGGSGHLTTVKGDKAKAKKVEVVGPVDYRQAKKLHQRDLTRFMIERIPGVDRAQSDALAKAVIWWMFHEAEKDMLTGAAQYEESDPWPLGDEE